MDPDFDHSPTPPEPMACSEPPPVHRDDVFKELLLKLSHKMSQDNAHELSFMAESGLPGTTTPLEVLIELQKQGVFSPRSCANLEGNLRKINRCDLADIVRQYMDAYPVTEPSPSGKLQERASIPMRRIATDPPSLFQHQISAHEASTTAPEGEFRPQVQQEQNMEGNSVLHVSAGRSSVRQVMSTPKHKYLQSQASSPGDYVDAPNVAPGMPIDHPTDEPILMRTPLRRHKKTPSYDQSISQGEQSYTSYGSFNPSSNPSSQGSHEFYKQSSRSATISREGSFRSLYSSSSQQNSSVKVAASRIAHMAIDLVTNLSQEHDEWYKSTSSYSLSSMSSSAKARIHSDTSSLCSESEGANSKPWNKKKQSQSFHGSHSSHAPPGFKRRPSAPAHYRDKYGTRGLQHQSLSHPTQITTTAEQEVESDVKNDVSYDTSTKISETAQLRPKKSQVNAEQSEAKRYSRVSDATLRQSIFSDGMNSVSSDATPRQSLILDATTSLSSTAATSSDGTITSPRTSISGRDSLQEVGERSIEADRETQKQNPPFPKEKSLLRRRLSFFRSKSRSNSPRSFVWKVPREDIIKPVWRHLHLYTITRQGKFELDVSPGKYNPKVLFLLYPNGLFEDSEKAVTMCVKIMTPEKCPPLPPSSEIRLSLVVWDGESGGVEMKRVTITEKLSTSVFYVFKVITHDQLKESQSKNFNFDIGIRVQRESFV